MKSAELAVAIQGWLDSGDSELKLLIGRAPVRLQRRTAGVLCIATLSVAWGGDDLDLETALHLSGPSCHYFSGALALDPVMHRLCLMHYLKFDVVTAIILALEALINQWDVWEELIKSNADPSYRLNRPQPLGNSYV